MLTGENLPPFGFVSASRAGESDSLLCDFVDRLLSRGVRVCGCVQRNPLRPGADRCDMIVTAHPSRNEFKISQDRGREAKGCRLDAGTLELVVADVEASLALGADILVINKFGKHEADGRGFCHVIGHALALGTPVLIAVGQINRQAFLAFADGCAKEIAADVHTLMDWAERSVPAL